MAIMYFLLIRPQQQRVKQLREKVDNVRRGDTVVTAGGIVGRVVKASQKEDAEVTGRDRRQCAGQGAEGDAHRRARQGASAEADKS